MTPRAQRNPQYTRGTRFLLRVIDALVLAAAVLLTADLLGGPQHGALAFPIGVVAMTLAWTLPADQDPRRQRSA